MRKLIDDKAILPPSPTPSPLFTVEISNFNPPSSFFDLLPSLPVTDSAYDLATLNVIYLLLLLSLLSLSIIFHLRLQSRWSHHLQNFSSIWSIRLLLVAFISIWAVNEILRLPLVRRQYIYSFMPPLTLTEEANICKTYLVLSLGLFQPSILITLLFLVRLSIKNKSPSNISAISAIGATCLPIMLLQILILFLSPLEAQLPAIMYRSSFLSEDIYGDKTVFCTYPLLSCMVFAAFGVVYALGLLMSCWRVLSLVINKCIRRRINVLALTVCMALPLQSLCMALSSMGSPENAAFSGVVMAMFVCVAICAVVGMCILVIMPTVDALAAVAEFDWWNSLVRLRLEGDVSCRSGREEGDGNL